MITKRRGKRGTYSQNGTLQTLFKHSNHEVNLYQYIYY